MPFFMTLVVRKYDFYQNWWLIGILFWRLSNL
jgi:hypothetical protein